MAELIPKFEIQLKDEDGDSCSVWVEEGEYRAWLANQMGGKMHPKRVKAFIENKIMEGKIIARRKKHLYTNTV